MKMRRLTQAAAKNRGLYMKRTILVTLTTDSEESIVFIEDDIRQELNCACTFFDEILIKELEGSTEMEETQ